MIKKENICKYNNKGFSLVELIIVIAIMAILSAALAPQLMKYVEKSRKSTDAQTCSSIENTVYAALAEEKVWNDMSGKRGKTFRFYIRRTTDGKNVVIDGLNVDGNSANAIREYLGNLKNPKQTGMESYEVIVYSTTIDEDPDPSKKELVYTIKGVEVNTSKKTFEANSAKPYNY